MRTVLQKFYAYEYTYQDMNTSSELLSMQTQCTYGFSCSNCAQIALGCCKSTFSVCCCIFSVCCMYICDQAAQKVCL